MVIARYLGSQYATGGTITSGSGSASSYTLHSFTNAGPSTTFVIPDLVSRLAATANGALSGTGSLRFDGPGVLTLTGTNTYSGGTTVAAGSLVGTASSLQGSIINNATVTFEQTTNGTYAGTLSGTGTLTKTGSGTLAISGTVSASGDTTVSGGRLLINGSVLTSHVTVANGATLGGSGVIGGLVTVQSGGSLAPGNSPGLLTVGSLELQAGSTTFMQLFGSGNVAGRAGAGSAGIDYDSIMLLNPHGLGYGGTLALDFGNLLPFADKSIFQLYSFTGTPSSHFGSVTAIGSGHYAGLTFSSEGKGVWKSTSRSPIFQTLIFNESTGQLLVVPEPSTYAMAFLGIACGGWQMFRRRRTQ